MSQLLKLIDLKEMKYYIIFCLILIFNKKIYRDKTDHFLKSLPVVIYHYFSMIHKEEEKYIYLVLYFEITINILSLAY